MATNARQAIDSTIYTAVTLSGDGYIQNVGTPDIYLQFAASLPASDNKDGHVLSRGEGIQVVGGVPGNQAYARVLFDGKKGYVISSS